MAIKISGTTVINDSRDIQNIGVGTITQLVSTNVNVSGVSSVGSGITLTSTGDIRFAGIITGRGSGLSGVTTTLVASVGVQSAGAIIGAGITQLNFIGAGNTFAVRGTTVDISIAGGGGSSGISISTNTTNQNQFLTYAIASTASTTGLGVTTTKLVYNPRLNFLGIGTSSPRANLDVGVSSAIIGGIGTQSSLLVAGDFVVSDYNSTPSFIKQVGIAGTSGDPGGIGVGWIGPSGLLFSLIDSTLSGVGTESLFSVSSPSNTLPFFNVDSAGNVGISTTSTQKPFHVHGGIRNTNRNAASTQTALHINTTTGDIAETASSKRFKRNIVDYEKGLETLINLRSVSFNFLEDDLPNAGLIAEEVHEAGLFEFVRYDQNGAPYSIPYDNLSALYINAIKDLKLEIDSLKIKINELTDRINNFSTQIN